MEAVSSISQGETLAAQQVKVINSQRKQEEAVSSTLLKGVAEAPTARSEAFPSGQRVNVAA